MSKKLKKCIGRRCSEVQYDVTCCTNIYAETDLQNAKYFKVKIPHIEHVEGKCPILRASAGKIFSIKQWWCILNNMHFLVQTSAKTYPWRLHIYIYPIYKSAPIIRPASPSFIHNIDLKSMPEQETVCQAFSVSHLRRLEGYIINT